MKSRWASSLVRSLRPVVHLSTSTFLLCWQVLIRPKTGANAGFIFEGTGAAPTDDDDGAYGGVVFAYDATRVRLWAPSRYNSGSDGRMVRVGGSWGDGQFSSADQTADVRVLAYRVKPHAAGAAAYDSDWFRMDAQVPGCLPLRLRPTHRLTG